MESCELVKMIAETPQTMTNESVRELREHLRRCVLDPILLGDHVQTVGPVTHFKEPPPEPSLQRRMYILRDGMASTTMEELRAFTLNPGALIGMRQTYRMFAHDPMVQRRWQREISDDGT